MGACGRGTGPLVLVSVLSLAFASCMAPTATRYLDDSDLNEAVDSGPNADSDVPAVDTDLPSSDGPLRVLYLIDSSDSMIVVDPPDRETGFTSRQMAASVAIEDLLTRFTEQVAVAAITFGNTPNVLTYADENGNGVADQNEGYFSSSREFLLGTDGTGGIVPQLGSFDHGSDYVWGLAAATSLVENEISRIADHARPSTRFVIVMFGDFLPDMAGDESSPQADLVVEQARVLREFGRLHGVSLELHCVCIETGRPGSDEAASSLGSQIAAAGGGTFESFPSADELDLIVDIE